MYVYYALDRSRKDYGANYTFHLNRQLNPNPSLLPTLCPKFWIPESTDNGKNIHCTILLALVGKVHIKYGHGLEIKRECSSAL